MNKSKVSTPVVTGDRDTDALLDMERINQELPEYQVALHSVGAVLDTEVAVLYPMNVDGSADYDSPFCLEDVDKGWYSELSGADHHIAHNTMLSFSSAPPNDVVLLKRMLEESYLMIKSMQQSKEEYGMYRKHIFDGSNSLLRRLDKITKVGTKAKEIEEWTS